MGWPGPMTWPQYLVWQDWLNPSSQEERLDDWDERVAENQRRKMLVEAEKEKKAGGLGVLVTLKKSDQRTAADILLSGISRSK